MPHHSVERYSWAVVQPSPSHSIKYLGSSLASSTASHLSCGKYLAVILEPSKATAWDAVAYLVQPAHFPLPDTYLPIFPCRIGPRHPLVPEFDWPFGDCVINTGKILVFRAVQVKSEAEAIRLSDESTRRLSAICDSDADKQIKADRARRIAETNAEREADGAPDDVSRWTSFSVKSTYVPATPGQIFPPSDIHARVSYNIKSLVDVRPASQCFEDERNIQRLRARFSRPATERTIVWNINQASSASPDPPIDELITELTPALLDLSASLERPHSPDRVQDVPKSILAPEELYALEDDDCWGMTKLRISSQKQPHPPPPFDSAAVQIMYFDVYGTLIDNESGIFDALQPLLAQAPRRLQRREALTFYFESETEVKQCMPTAPYPQILARAHSDMATRLGLVATEEQSSLFASSIATWPLFNGALWCLQTLNPWIPILVALCDVDHESLRVTSAFTALAPYFAEVFTWDASHAYRPDRTAFDPPFRYHDALGVPREQRCLISNSVLRDLEPAHELDFPAIWMRYPESLAGTVPSMECSAVLRVCADFPDLVFPILSGKGAIPQRSVAHCGLPIS